MISVLGLELSEAERLLKERGYEVELIETRSRKGLEGNEARVVRERVKEGVKVELLYAVFKTDYKHGG